MHMVFRDTLSALVHNKTLAAAAAMAAGSQHRIASLRNVAYKKRRTRDRNVRTRAAHRINCSTLCAGGVVLWVFPHPT